MTRLIGCPNPCPGCFRGDFLVPTFITTFLYSDVGRSPDMHLPWNVQKKPGISSLIFNWFWDKETGLWDEAQAANHGERFEQMDFRQILGTFTLMLTSEIENYDVRRTRATLLDGAPSAWFATSEFGFEKALSVVKKRTDL